ncbi:putative lipid kinase BmrU [mine drainage metagenome]|uniref:Putative lipid kinase BmrU n=1 Tax=mine drainage metagenome TaxID=410659 RepID=A0A1J5TD44_9ZZZZ
MQILSIAILVNPFAGKGKSNRLAVWLEKQLISKNIPSTIFRKQWPSTFDDFSDIWIIGGDGTINYFINHYPECKLPIALFKGGTGDDFAWKLYGDISNDEQLELILNASPRFVDAGKFNSKLFINCLGVGFDGEILQSMNTIRFIGGHFGYLLAVIKKIFSFHEPRFVITAAEEVWNEKILLLMINNSSRAGGGFFVAPNASINDGKLDMVFCKKLSVLQRLRYVPVIEKGKHLHLPFVVHRLGEKFTIECDAETAVQVDGELYFAKDLHIEILPNQFLFRY